MSALEAVDEFLNQHAQQNVEQLKDFLRIASVSADSAFAAEMTKAAPFIPFTIAPISTPIFVYP